MGSRPNVLTISADVNGTACTADADVDGAPPRGAPQLGAACIAGGAGSMDCSSCCCGGGGVNAAAAAAPRRLDHGDLWALLLGPSSMLGTASLLGTALLMSLLEPMEVTGVMPG